MKNFYKKYFYGKLDMVLLFAILGAFLLLSSLSLSSQFKINREEIRAIKEKQLERAAIADKNYIILGEIREIITNCK